jgi:hypothetical protein
MPWFYELSLISVAWRHKEGLHVTDVAVCPFLMLEHQRALRGFKILIHLICDVKDCHNHCILEIQTYCQSLLCEMLVSEHDWKIVLLIREVQPGSILKIQPRSVMHDEKASIFLSFKVSLRRK